MVLKEGTSEARSVLRWENLFLIVPLGMIATIAWSVSSSHPFQSRAEFYVGMIVMSIGLLSIFTLMPIPGEKAIPRAVATLFIAIVGLFILCPTAMHYDNQAENLVKEAYSSQFDISQDKLSVKAWSKDSAKMSGFADQCEQKNVSCYSVDVPGKNKHESVTRYVLAHTSPDKVKSLEALAERTVKIEVKKF